MTEKIGLVFETTVEDVRAIFEKNIPLKEAFDNLWKSQQMDECLKNEAWPALKECPDAIDDFQELQKATEIILMTESLHVGIQRLMAEYATSFLVDCTVQAITEEAESIVNTCKAAFFESLIKLYSMWSIEQGIGIVTMTS